MAATRTGSTRRRVVVLKSVAWGACLAPLGWLAWRWFAGDGLGVNPIEELTLWTGLTAVIILLASLAVTPVRRLTGFNEVQRVRRLLGLFAFFWAGLHFLVWMGLDQGFAWSYIGEDLTERPFIIVGALSLLAMVPLALTSTRAAIRRLGRNWVRLHRLVYPAAGLALLHYTWKQKADITWPLVAWAVFAVLMGYRIWSWSRKRSTPGGGAGGRSPARAPDGGELAG